MASHRVGGGTGLSDSGPSPHHHHLPYSLFSTGLNHPNSTFINQEGSTFDFGELEEAIVLQGIKINSNDDPKLPLYTAARPAATLEMFPSWPIRFHQTSRGSPKSGGGGGESTTDSGSGLNTTSKADATAHLEAPESPLSSSSRKTSSEHNQQQASFYHHNHHHQQQQQQQQLHLPLQQVEMESTDQEDSPPLTGGSSHSQPSPKPTSDKRKGGGSTSERKLDAKTLRRLAQNREAARKSRLRKKAYVQQLETSRIRLTQLEQDLQRARNQGLFLGGGGPAGGSISPGAAIFDMEYARWLEDDQRHMAELRTAFQAQLSDAYLRVIVDAYIAHYDEIFQLKGVAAKSDVFHLITGMWTTPAERCFLWMGGFRPSDLIKMLATQLDPLTEQQVVGIYSLQQSSQQAEEALTQGQDQLQQSLIDTIASGSINDGVHHMAVAIGKLSNLEGFVRQADNLRQQTLHQLHRILTVRQAAKCFLVIGEYYSRLRALSSLWASRPRETLMSDENSCQTASDLQLVQSSQNHFTNF